MRVSPKDLTNECPLFDARTSLERETSTSAAPPATASSGSQGGAAHSTTARKAFDDLFKF
jgi:hypothetical protein